MGQSRISEEGISERKEKISRLETQIEIWRATGEITPGMDIIRRAVAAGKVVEEKEVLARVKNLAFSTEPDRADLAKHAGTLAAYDSIYYDIFEAGKKIAGAELMIARLVEEIARAKKGELIETGA